MTLQELASWRPALDKYRLCIRELVVQGEEHPEKFNIMGAWKILVLW
jgi:hypothetical protein